MPILIYSTKYSDATFKIHVFVALANIVICLGLGLIIGKGIGVASALDTAVILLKKYPFPQAIFRMFLPPTGILSAIALIISILFNRIPLVVLLAYVANGISSLGTVLFFFFLVTSAHS